MAIPHREAVVPAEAGTQRRSMARAGTGTSFTSLDPRLRGDDAGPKPRARASAARGLVRRHLTMPTAFIVAPRSASDLAMNFANSSGGRVDHAEAALRHEVGVVLARDDLAIAATSLSRASGGRFFGAAMPRHAAIVQLLPVAAFSVGTFGYSAAGASGHHDQALHLAGVDERARFRQRHRRDLHAAGDQILQSRRGAVRRAPTARWPDRS